MSCLDLQWKYITWWCTQLAWPLPLDHFIFSPLFYLFIFSAFNWALCCCFHFLNFLSWHCLNALVLVVSQTRRIFMLTGAVMLHTHARLDTKTHSLVRSFARFQAILNDIIAQCVLMKRKDFINNRFTVHSSTFSHSLQFPPCTEFGAIHSLVYAPTHLFIHSFIHSFTVNGYEFIYKNCIFLNIICNYQYQ